eukprot:m.54751 g.54751  ORF g.54751 m.54751 type:complete len:837 (-) comp7728_c2_seq2:592-3102(-)
MADSDERAFIASVCDTPDFRADMKRREKIVDTSRNRMERFIKSCDDMVQKGNQFEDATSLFLANMKHLASSDMNDASVRTILQLHSALSEIQRCRKLLLEQTVQSLTKPMKFFISTELQGLKEQGKIVSHQSDKLDNARQKYAACNAGKLAECQEARNFLESCRGAYNHTIVDYVRDLRVFEYTFDIEILERFVLYVSSLTTSYKQSMDIVEDLQPAISNISVKINEERTRVKEVTKKMDERHTVISNWTKADILSKSIQEGYLYKRGQNKFKTWQRRFFSLQQNGSLMYTSREKFEGWKVFVDDLRLCTVKLIPSEPVERQFCFELVTPSRSFLLQAESENEKRRWIQAVQDGIGSALGQMHRGSTVSHFVTDSPEEQLQKAREKQRRRLQLDVFEKEGNSTCADCDATDPDWMSINLGITLCIECSGAHRSLGTHVSKVRSLTLDKIDSITSQMMLSLGNICTNNILEGLTDAVSSEKSKADTEKSDREKYIRNKYIEKMYADFSASPHGQDSDVLGMALFEAAKVGDLTGAHQAILYGAEVDYVREKDKQTPLMVACDTKQPIMIHFLLVNNAERKLVDVNGNSPLHFCALRGDFPSVCVLVKFGVDVNMPNNDGKTAIDIVRDLCHDGEDETDLQAHKKLVAIINLLQLYSLGESENDDDLAHLQNEGLQQACRGPAPPPPPKEAKPDIQHRPKGMKGRRGRNLNVSAADRRRMLHKFEDEEEVEDEDVLSVTASAGEELGLLDNDGENFDSSGDTVDVDENDDEHSTISGDDSLFQSHLSTSSFEANLVAQLASTIDENFSQTSTDGVSVLDGYDNVDVDDDDNDEESSVA